MDDGLRYFQSIHTAVLKVAGNNRAPGPMELCRQVLEELGMPPEAANPLVARSFASHLMARKQKDILAGHRSPETFGLKKRQGTT
jgi:hypothetical protein